MGLTGSATATVRFDDVRVAGGRRLGEEGQSLAIVLAGLDAGRLGIVAVAVGLAQGALDDALAYAKALRPSGQYRQTRRPEAAMRVTTDAVQVFDGAGYTQDFPVERYMREARVMQIFEGTNQIQRLVISRHLVRARTEPSHHVLRTAAEEPQA